MRKLFKENKKIVSLAIGLEILGYVLAILAGYGYALNLMFGFAFLAPAIAVFLAKDKIFGRFFLGFIIIGSRLIFDLAMAWVLVVVFPPEPGELGLIVGFGIPILVAVIFAGLVGAVIGGVIAIIKEKSKMTEKELLIILILAVLATVFLGYFIRFPLPLAEPVSYMQRSRITGELIEVSEPARINLSNGFLGFLFWFAIMVMGWWVLRFVSKKIKMKK